MSFRTRSLETEMLEGFYIGNVIKYTIRYRHKNGVDDLRKARWYLERAIGLVGSRDKVDE